MLGPYRDRRLDDTRSGRGHHYGVLRVSESAPTSGPSRRRFLTSTSTLIGGAALGGVAVGGGAAIARDKHDKPSAARGSATEPIAFEGQHQPGIVDRQPAALRFLALDLSAPTALRATLVALSATARAVMAGQWPDSSDVATGLNSAGLTVSIGLGASALQKAGRPVPAPLAPLPAFAGDQLDATRSGGDLGLQICAEDPMIVAAASRALLRAVAGRARLRWSQTGFLRSRDAAQDPDATPRNLMGQLDGTDNPTGSRLNLAVWVPPGVEPTWMANGTYLVCRRIRMLLDDWEQLAVADQEQVIGRRKDTGAPLTGTAEHDLPSFAATADGRPVIAANAHIRLTHPANNSGASMLRRGFSYDDGVNAAGQLDAGLFFQAFQTDPHRVFVPIQHKLSATDALSRFIRHEASAVFAFPGGASAGGFVGEHLF